VTTEVNPDRVRLLVADLRTPGLKQATGVLTERYDDGTEGDCCLGRACKVAIANGIEGVEAILSPFTEPVSYQFDIMGPDGSHRTAEQAVLPLPVQTWFGFDTDAPNLRGPDGGFYAATDLNDEKKWTFEQIATAFEVTFLGGEYPADAMTWPGMPLHPSGLEEDEEEEGDDEQLLVVVDEPFGKLEP
jgi:hypothetical protein